MSGKTHLKAKESHSSHFYSGVFATSLKENGSMGVFRGKGTLRRKDWPGFEKWELSSEINEESTDDSESVLIDLDTTDFQ